jgi:hypothetical protein
MYVDRAILDLNKIKSREGAKTQRKFLAFARNFSKKRRPAKASLRSEPYL